MLPQLTPCGRRGGKSTLSTRETINASLDMVCRTPAGGTFYRVHAEQVDAGRVVAEASWPAVCTLDAARRQLDELRIVKDNSVFTYWYITRTQTHRSVTLVNAQDEE